MEKELVIIGGGLAGSEAAWQAAELGVKVKLYEMRPFKMTPAHHTSFLGELVCSNSVHIYFSWILNSLLNSTFSNLVKFNPAF
jgi:folate-dependent tRNA-U54 methylase TrmFO/GidA